MSEGLKLSEHIDELRRRVKVVFITLMVAILVVLLLPLNPRELLSLTTVYWTTPVTIFLGAIRGYVLPPNWQLIGFHVNEPLEVLLVASIVLALAIDMPVIAYETYKFIDPALKEKERRAVYPVVISATCLFIVGVLFGYLILARFIFFALQPFFGATGAATVIDVSDFYFIVFLTIVFSGAAFVTPVFVFLLIRFGVLSPKFFSKNRVLIWAVTYVVTAIITPDGGPLLDVILFVPVIVLLELAVLIGRRYAPETLESSAPACKYCGAILEPRRMFCEECGRAVG